MKNNENTSFKVENIVSSDWVADAIDMEFISANINDCSFSRRKFPGALYHMQDLKSAALILESGRVVITGLRRPESTPMALQNLLNRLKEAGIICLDKPIVAITNIVCSCDFGY